MPFAALPGDDKPDDELLRLSTVDPADWHALWSYLVEGGPENSANFLRYARSMLDGGDPPSAAMPLLHQEREEPKYARVDIRTKRLSKNNEEATREEEQPLIIRRR